MHVAIVDLNNFARYPTLSVGYLASNLRAASHQVSVISPLASGVGSFSRVTRPHSLGQYEAIIRHYSAISSCTGIRDLRNWIARQRSPARAPVQQPTVEVVRNVLRQNVDLLMISAYTMYRDVCTAICAEATARSVPVIVGGPMFSVAEVTKEWLEIPGLSGVFVGEPEANLHKVLRAVSNYNEPVEGLIRPGDATGGLVAPMTDLDQSPFPDYTDFPWERYPNKIVPLMTGRGCGWGVCTFCSDVHTTSGRTFRSRSFENVFAEMRHQSLKHHTKTFTFLDLKLNSNLEVWNGLLSEAQSAVPGCEWTASVHVNINGGNGLQADDLKKARQAGLSRITTGLESGSQRMLNSMARGTNLDALSQFVRHASEAGISVRMTSIIGYPGETADDVRATASFLDQHYQFIDRIVVNRLAISPLTPLGMNLIKNPSKFPQIQEIALNTGTGLLDHDNTTFRSKGHLGAVVQLLGSAHRINRKPLNGASRTFEGVM